MQPSKPFPAEVFVSERATEVFIEAIDPDDPDDLVFVEFIDEPSEAPDLLAYEPNRLADSEGLDVTSRCSAWTISVSWDSPFSTVIATIGILGYLAALGILLLS
ncbi:MAG: hypothetical protein ACPG4T_01170 [Nannocystaceae bacterium]